MAETRNKGEEIVRAGVAARTGRLLPPPVGTSDWARFSRTSYCVDCSQMTIVTIVHKSQIANESICTSDGP